MSGRGGNGDATVRFDIWDTVGQERYHSLAPMYYRCAVAAVVVYDISSTMSENVVFSSVQFGVESEFFLLQFGSKNTLCFPSLNLDYGGESILFRFTVFTSDFVSPCLST